MVAFRVFVALFRPILWTVREANGILYHYRDVSRRTLRQLTLDDPMRVLRVSQITCHSRVSVCWRNGAISDTVVATVDVR